MALIARHEAIFRAKQRSFEEASENLANLETDLRRSLALQKAWKTKMFFKIFIAILQQNVNRQQRLFRRIDQLNHVRFFIYLSTQDTVLSYLQFWEFNVISNSTLRS